MSQTQYQPHLSDENWLRTNAGVERGYVDAHTLDELWFHTGTRCNLSCPFCLEGSSPTANRLKYLTLEDVKPYLNEACELGVNRFSFTGGEPFLNKEMLAILKAALQLKPCLVLTNGTKPLIKKMDDLEALQSFDHPLHFRISVDQPSAEKHDEGRGRGSFSLALQSIVELQKRGFKVSIARHAEAKENKKEVEAQYTTVLKTFGVNTDDLKMIAFPDFLPPGSRAAVPEITTSCMTTYQNETSRKEFMCAFSRMIIKRDQQTMVSACTLVDDDPDYDLSASLKQSLETRVMLRHHRCFSCFSFGASCSEGT